MKVSLRKRGPQTRRHRTAFAALLALSLASCSSSGASDSKKQEATAELNVVDAMFVDMMLPHHEQAIVMADMALEPSRGAGSDVVELARQIKEVQEAEILVLTELLAMVGDSLDGHVHEMKGMLSEEELAELGSLQGADFDKEWLEGMIAHHEGAVEMAQDVLRDGSNERVRMLAKDVESAQRAEIDIMKSLVD